MTTLIKAVLQEQPHHRCPRNSLLACLHIGWCSRLWHAVAPGVPGANSKTKLMLQAAFNGSCACQPCCPCYACLMPVLDADTWVGNSAAGPGVGSGLTKHDTAIGFFASPSSAWQAVVLLLQLLPWPKRYDTSSPESSSLSLPPRATPEGPKASASPAAQL